MTGDVFGTSRHRTTTSVPSPVMAGLVLLGFVFVVGLFAGVLLFGSREALPTTVVVCPAPGTANVAVWPKECPREAVAP
ncbi:hypothetical protein HLB23_39405 [Nocardia uniformis]|uniref:Uncharacterized protein n=1 Tax=Nocardia uniformis TaxID=53432 RepID=A0A849CG84_9NOCA|nr:hypothetical protein [Nocardia uniformis]NNH75855.1 hypothetical protein [Nocardia uniformis]